MFHHIKTFNLSTGLSAVCLASVFIELVLCIVHWLFMWFVLYCECHPRLCRCCCSSSAPCSSSLCLLFLRKATEGFQCCSCFCQLFCCLFYSLLVHLFFLWRRIHFKYLRVRSHARGEGYFHASQLSMLGHFSLWPNCINTFINLHECPRNLWIAAIL